MKASLTAILVVAAAARIGTLALVWNHQLAAWTPDSDTFTVPAHSLYTTGAFQTEGQPELLRTPGYPAFLLLAEPFGRNNWRVALVAQVILDLALVYLTFRLGAALVDQRVGLWAAGFQALSVPAIVCAAQIMSDGLFAFALTVTVMLLVRHFRGDDWRWLAAAGGMTAVAAYVRPVAFILVPVVLVILLARARAGRNALVYAAVFGALVGPWIARNWLRAGYPNFSSAGDENLFVSEAAGVWARVQGVPTAEARRQLSEDLRRRIDEMRPPPSPAQIARMQRDIGQRIIRQHPVLWGKMHLRTSLNSFLPAGTGLLEMAGITTGHKGTLSVLHTQGLLAAARHYFGARPHAALLLVPEVLLLLAKYAGVLVWGIGCVRPRMRPAGWLLLLTIVAFTFVAGPVASARFRLPVEPLLSVTAAMGIVLIRHRFDRARIRARTDDGPRAHARLSGSGGPFMRAAT